jgi:hypothetical protein
MKPITFISLLLSFNLHSEEQVTVPKTADPIPGNEIWLFDVSEGAAGELTLSAGHNITNHPGYDSQPRFSADGQVIYFTREIKSEQGSQMDIYAYHVPSGKTSPYMTTAESEYSPTIGYEKPGLSVVQVDSQGDQYVVLLDKDAPEAEQVKRFSDLKQVGYFNWTGGHKWWGFVLNDTSGGDLYHIGGSKQPTMLVENVGRTFVTDVTNQLVYYVDKNTTPWRIKSRQRKLHESKDVMALPLGVEDFTVDSQGRFWAGSNSTLMVSTDLKAWKEVKTFTSTDLQSITRLTTNPDANKIAIVFAEKPASE